MNDEQIDVKIRAQTSELKPGMDSAARDTEQATSRMRQSMQDAAERMKSALSGIVGHFQGLGNAAREHVGGASETIATHAGAMSQSLGGLTGAFSKVNAAIAAVSTVLAGGAVFAKGIEATKEFTGEAIKLSRTLGINATAASALNVALGDVYTDSETYTSAAAMLGRQLRQNEEALQAMGLKTRDANGDYRNLNDLMMDSIQVINQYKEGTDRNLAAMTMWGRGASEATGLLKLNSETVDAAKQKQQELGLVVGESNVQALTAYKAAMNDTGDIMLALKKAIGDAVMPVLTQLSEWFNAIGPAAVVVIKGSIGGLVAVFWGLKFAGEAVWNAIAYVVEATTIKILRLAETVGRALMLDFSGAKAAWERGTQQLEDVAQKRLKNVMDDAEETRGKLADLFGNPETAKDSGNKGTKSYVDPKTKDTKTKDSKEESQAGKWETELAEMKTALQEKANAEGTFQQMSKQQELSYWQTKLALTKSGSADNLSVRKKVAELQQNINKEAFDTEIAGLRRQEAECGNNAAKKIAIAQKEVDEIARVYGVGSKEYEKAEQRRVQIAKEAAQQAQQIGTIAAERQAAQKLAEIDAAETTAKLDQQIGRTTKAELLLQEEQFEQQRNAIKQQALDERLAMADPELDRVKYAQLKQQIEQQELAHIQRLRDIRAQQAEESEAPETAVFKTMESSFDSAMLGMLTRAQSWRASLQSIYKSLYTTFLQEMITKPMAQMAARFIRETLLYKLLGITQTTEQVKASASTTAVKAGEATAVVSSNAAEAASGAAASASSIPFVGWVMAGAAFAAVLAMVLGAKSNIKSASGGFDIPAGTNPMTQLHEQEMVLPAHIANPLREQLAGGGASGGGDVHYHDYSGKLTQDEIRRNARTIASELARVHGSGWRPA